MTTKTYRIFHNYDQGDQSVYLSSSIDPTRAAIYCQFLAEDQLGESASVQNSGIAKALVQFYGCTPAEKIGSAVELDLYFAREAHCGKNKYEQLMADQSLHREGIIDVIRPYTHGIEDDLAKAELIKFGFPRRITDAAGHLLREISRVGTLGGVSHEEGRVDGLCMGLRLAGALDNAQEEALKMTLTRAIVRKKHAVRAFKAGEQVSDVSAAGAKHTDSERYTAGLAFVASGDLDPDGHENETNAPYYFGHSAIQAFEAGAVWQAKRITENK